MVEQALEYDPWNKKESPEEVIAREEKAQRWIKAHEWRRRESPEYIQSLSNTWREQRDSLEECIKCFVGEVQEIIDEKITTGEHYDKHSYKTYLRIKGLIPYDTSKKISADDVKATVRIEEVVGRYISLRHTGATYIGKCPFHDDGSPSFTIFTKSQTAHCFGCGEHQDVIGFIMKIEKLTFLQALNKLNNNI